MIKDQIEEVNLIDFGLASEIRESLTRVSQIRLNTSGTRPYMPPEQWRGRKQNAKTDQYSLAVVAYELYAGNLPFISADIEMLRLAVLQDLPERIKGIPDSINDALLKALSKDQVDRYENCVEFIDALSRENQATIEEEDKDTAEEAGLIDKLLQITPFETEEEYSRRLRKQAPIKIGYGEFLFNESDADREYYPIQLTQGNSFIEADKFEKKMPERLNLTLSHQKAREIYQKTSKIPLYGRAVPSGRNWKLSLFYLKSGDWQFDVSAEIQRLAEEEEKRKRQEDEFRPEVEYTKENGRTDVKKDHGRQANSIIPVHPAFWGSERDILKRT